MGNKSSLTLQDDEIRNISDETGFGPSEIEKLYTRFAHLDRANCGSLARDDLANIPELASNPLCDRLVQTFFTSQPNDANEEERVNFRRFIRVLASFKSGDFNQAKGEAISADRTNRVVADELAGDLITVSGGASINEGGHKSTDARRNQPNESLGNKLQFVFKIYDVDDDGKINFTDLRSILKMMVGSHIEPLQLDKIVTRAFIEVDKDGDGFVDFHEFCKVFSLNDIDDKLRVKFFT